MTSGIAIAMDGHQDAFSSWLSGAVAAPAYSKRTAATDKVPMKR